MANPSMVRVPPSVASASGLAEISLCDAKRLVMTDRRENYTAYMRIRAEAKYIVKYYTAPIYKCASIN